MKAPLVFAPVTRWVLAWQDGALERIYSITGRDMGPYLYVSKSDAEDTADTQTPRPKPVKVRVTIEAAMTGRSDYGSRPWRYPALLSDAPSDTLRRGAQQDILQALRHLLARPSGASSSRPEAAPLGTRRPGEVTR